MTNSDSSSTVVLALGLLPAALLTPIARRRSGGFGAGLRHIAISSTAELGT